KMIVETDLMLSARGDNGEVRGKSLEEMERRHIRRILLENRWNVSSTAQQLGIDRVTLYNKIKKYQLKKEKTGT
ncbi:MAG TPA: helix-turn-helix domain-containing protein, partial [Candidatus Deferrimicrobiaceae bacterium]|nr:helix-turn-helix domain-containing protein [Candidatus Deferrimicrobiaceae bacterium]